MLWTAVGVLFFMRISYAADPLESYNVNPDLVTVSGLSAGGAFSTQIHVALSGTIKGAAVFAGLPYYCAEGSFILTSTCMFTPWFVDVDDLIDQADQYSASGDIDSTLNIQGQRVAIWHGGFDFTVNPGASDLIEEFYVHYGAETRFETVLSAGHCMPTEDYGNSCSLTLSPYINDCDYAGAYRAVNWLYGETLEKPDDGVSTTELLEYDQNEFAGDSEYFDTEGGYLYVPVNCSLGAECALHVAFHGCNQGREVIGNEFALHAGYLEVAEANNIIVLFPQIIGDGLFGENPNGCFDWWAYDGFDYATRNGAQVSAVKAMIDRVLGN